MFRKTSKKGFSLVELLVVITIIAILSVVAYTAVGGQTVKAKNSRRMQDISTMQQALEIYFAENSSYPDSLDAGDTVNTHHRKINETQLGKKYISNMPTDPWSTSAKKVYYYYDILTGNKQYQIAATIEGETSNTAFVAGNGTDLIKDKTNTVVTDGGALVPYEKPVTP